MATMIHSSLVVKAMEAAEIPLGGALVINIGGENDGTFKFDVDAPDFADVMSKLTGLVLEMHALKTMVIPSNMGRLNDARNFLAALGNGRDLIRMWDREALAEQLVGFAEEIEQVQHNLAFKD